MPAVDELKESLWYRFRKREIKKKVLTHVFICKPEGEYNPGDSGHPIRILLTIVIKLTNFSEEFQDRRLISMYKFSSVLISL